MADPEDIGPQYQCEECGVWSPDTTCVQCGAELGEDVRGVPVVHAKDVIAEGVVMYQKLNGRMTINGVDIDRINQDAFDDYARGGPRRTFVEQMTMPSVHFPIPLGTKAGKSK